MLEAELDVSEVKQKIVSFIKEKVEASQTEGGYSSWREGELRIDGLSERGGAGDEEGHRPAMPDMRVARRQRHS